MSQRLEWRSLLMRFTLEASLLQVLVSSSLSDRGFSGNGTWKHDTGTPKKVKWTTKYYTNLWEDQMASITKIIEDLDALKQANLIAHYGQGP